MRIYLPKRVSPVDFSYGPFFFLAGPVRGGDDWQQKFCTILRGYIPHFTAALPCRYPEDHPLLPHSIYGHMGEFEHQQYWERHYIEIAAEKGCLVFWLPEESKERPRGNGEPYALETYGEIAEWRGHLMHNPKLRIVIGAEAGFPGLKQITRNYCRGTNSNFPIYGTMEETVCAALLKAGR
ncbi:MAG TPA: hypothetical protein VJ579_04995 [Candidatus Paceibacterota bacterium]|nr:hypothetical protein [Candidatus Paceibacterota bacterium]